MSAGHDGRARPIDFQKHNDEVKAIWDAFHQRKPSRVPVIVSGSIRNLFNNPEVNKTGYTFEDFFKNPQAQIECQLAFQKWVRFNWICDQEMGVPEKGWPINVDFQNSRDAGWFGCPIQYFGSDIPDTVEILKDNKEKLYELGNPDPLRGNLLGRAMDFFEYMRKKCPQMEFEGRPVLPPRGLPLFEITDGPFDAAYKLRGAENVCVDMYEDEKHYHDLMAYITENLIRRIKALKEWRWSLFPDEPDRGKFKSPNFSFADDAVAMISTDDYRKFVFPYHQRLVNELSDGGPVSIHLCGDATRHFKFLRDQLNVQTFDTGFPVDFGKLRSELGPDVLIQGGPTVMLLKDGTPQDIHREVKRICESGIMAGGRFVLREGNNLAPRTPLENIAAMYAAGKQYGRYA